MKKRIFVEEEKGFALIATISLLVLLALVAVGLLSLSTISVRSAGSEAAMAEARANARLALVMAIGQLQKHAGDDRRITMAADQLPGDSEGSATAAAPERRFWTGVYEAWDDGMVGRPDPEWLAWLVSDPDPSSMTEEDATGLSGGRDAVRLVGKGSAGEMTDDWVEVPAIPLQEKGRLAGRLAWWTGDQGVKAALATSSSEAATNMAEVRGRLQGAPHTGVGLARTRGGEPFRGLEREDPRLAALTDWPQASLLAADPETPKELFHDLAAQSSGLLVNVREGGFRHDLSFELDQRIHERRIEPLVRLGRETGINFQELQSYYRLSQELVPLSGRYTTGGSIPSGTLGLRLNRTADQCRNDPYHHFKHPTIISYQAVFSLKVEKVPDQRGRTVNRLYFVVDPVITFWNPLDVPVQVPRTAFLSIKYFQFPYSIVVQAGGRRYMCPLVSSLSGATRSQHGDTNYLSLRAGEAEPLIFKPGEVIKVSQSGDMLVQGTQTDHNLQGKTGFNFGGGVARPMLDQLGRNIDLPDGATITYTMEPNQLTAGKRNGSGQSLSGEDEHTRHFSMNHHEVYIGKDRLDNSLGIGGIYVDFDFGNERVEPGRARESGTRGTKPRGHRIYANRKDYADIFPKFSLSDTRALSVGQLVADKAPIMMYSYNAKTETTSETGTRTMLRFNPKAHHVDFYDLSQEERDMLPYELVVEPLNSWVNRKLETSESGNAYFGGGFDASDGTSFVTTHSVPHEPIHSLAALQHSMANGFQLQKPQYGYAALNGRDVLLPQVAHAIGNSYALPMLDPDETSKRLSGGRTVVDHSYLTNEALWDRWFFSSIAELKGPTFGKARDQQEVAEEFFEGTSPLPISRYRPDLGGLTADDALSQFFRGSRAQPDAAEFVAQFLRVEGMFNVNSTSVEAWKALIGSLLGEDVATRSLEGAITRTTTSYDAPVAGLFSPMNEIAKGGKGEADVRDVEQWVGRRELSETEITLLAEAIVKEVRKRGPFLSLADFVNRRLTTDTDLARAGAIQAALDSEDVPINEPYQSGFRRVTGSVADRAEFPEAEEGALSAGIPGIVKQADILTPLAPILSVRSDSFLVRGYGESIDANGKVTARAWCEAMVERDGDYLSPNDARGIHPDDLEDGINEEFGRGFRLRSFRWLAPEEV